MTPITMLACWSKGRGKFRNKKGGNSRRTRHDGETNNIVEEILVSETKT